MISALAIAIGGILWRVGGRGGFPFAKQLRRIGVPAVIMSASLLNGHGWFALFAVLYIPLFAVGYGVDSKIGRLFGHNGAVTRFVCGFLYCLPSIGLLWGNWWLLGFDFAVTAVGVMLAGNQKFGFNDSREECFIGCLICMCKVW